VFTRAILHRVEQYIHGFAEDFRDSLKRLHENGEETFREIKRIREQQDKSATEAQLNAVKEQKQQLLDSLRFDQIDARQMTIKNAHIKTCK
jgi:hypothetical protein